MVMVAMSLKVVMVRSAFVFIIALIGLPIGYSVIVALTGLPIGYSVIVALTGLPIGYSLIVALIGDKVIFYLQIPLHTLLLVRLLSPHKKLLVVAAKEQLFSSQCLLYH